MEPVRPDLQEEKFCACVERVLEAGGETLAVSLPGCHLWGCDDTVVSRSILNLRYGDGDAQAQAQAKADEGRDEIHVFAGSPEQKREASTGQAKEEAGQGKAGLEIEVIVPEEQGV